MAIHNNPYMFSGGAERFNSQPETNLYAQLMARKRAQGDAIDDYYRKHADTLNPEGVRYKDLPDFQKAVEDYKTHAIQNKEKLRKNDIPTQIESEQLYRKAQGIIVGSKDAAMGEKEGLAVGEKLRTEDKNAEPMFQELQQNQLPISDPNYKRFNSGQYFTTPKNYDEQAHLAKFKNLQRDEETTLGKVDQKTGYRIDTYTKTLPQDKKDQVAAQAMMDYHDVWSFNDRVRDIIKNPEEKKKLSDFYQQQFGKVPESNEQLAAAYVLRGVNPIITEQGKPVRDEKWMLDYKQEQDKAMVNYKHALDIGDTEEAGKWVDRYLNSKKKQVQQSKPQAYVEAGTGWEMPLDVNLRKAFTVKVGGKDVEPDKLILKEDGKYVPIYYQYKDGKIVHKDNDFPVVDYTLTVPHTQEDVKLAMGVKTGVKQLNVEMGGGTKKTSTRTSYSYKGKTFTHAQIEAKAKQNGVSVEDYLKANPDIK